MSTTVVTTVDRVIGADCARAWRNKPYRETLTLRDGRRVMLRPIHRSDAPALQRLFFRGLSPRARLLRFHGVVNDMPEAALRALTTQVPRRHVALAAVTTTNDGLSTLLAEARYAVDDDGEAEFAVAVADAWQGHGLGRALLLRLAAHARTEGIAMLNGAVVPGNEPMLRLMRSLGAEVLGCAPEVTVRLVL